MTDEKSPLSAVVLLADISDKIDRVASISAQQSLQTARAVRILDANHQLSARDRMALVDVGDNLKKLVGRLETAAEKLAPRPASLTVVSDKEEEDWSLVNIKLPGARKMIAVPNRVLWAMTAGGIGTLLGWVGHMLLKWLSR